MNRILCVFAAFRESFFLFSFSKVVCSNTVAVESAIDYDAPQPMPTTAPSVFQFSVAHSDRGSQARTGFWRTPHGTVETPAFMPVGTVGSVKGLTPDQLREAGVEMVLANTYHLALRSGP